MKRWFTFFLAIVLLIPSLGMAAEKPASFDPSDLNRFSVFDEAWFLQDAHIYQHPLCLASIQLAQAAFRGDDTAPDASIVSFLSERNFLDIQIDEYAWKNSETIGSAIAHRSIGDQELVVIALCGGNYGLEWLSNFDVGTSKFHKGFSESAEKVLNRIAAYLERYQLQNPRFWIAGFSRAAAVSNLTAAFLAEKAIADDSDIFCYTFATPRTVIDENSSSQHQNIYNIIHFADLVPHVPLSSWGYGWYGNTLYLPSSLYSKIPYSDMLPAFCAAFSYLTGADPVVGMDISMLYPAVLAGDFDYADKAYLCTKGMTISVPNTTKYQAQYQKVIGKLITGEEMMTAEQMMLLTVLMNAANTALKEEGVIISFTGKLEDEIQKLLPLAPMLMQHMPQVYAAWLISMNDADQLMNHAPALTK